MAGFPAAARVEVGMAVVVAVHPHPSAAGIIPAAADPEIIRARCLADDLDPGPGRLADDDDLGNRDEYADTDVDARIDGGGGSAAAGKRTASNRNPAVRSEA